MSQIKHCAHLLAWLFLLNGGASAFAFSAADANALSSAYISDFYVQSGTNGWFKNNQTGGVTYFWGQAEEIECVIDAYEWTTNAVYKSMITNLLNGFMTDNGSSWYGNNGYNDDNLWAIMAFARGGVDTGMTNYCNLAKADFDAIYARAWSTNLGGGLYWQYPENASKNACVNGPGAIAAYLLYQIYGDTNYLNKATNIYYWERSVLFNTGNGAIADNIGTNGTVNGGATTYNQGTFIGAADFLGLTNDAALTAAFTMASMTSSETLPQYGIAGNNSGFNAIFLRWMARFMRNHNSQNLYEPWLQANATAAWNMRRTADNLSWCQWRQASPVGTNFYSWDCISSFEAILAANPTQIDPPLPVPAVGVGYWPLDSTSGTSAIDLSGNGNNGVVNGATWNASGRVNGCLSFNGVNNSVQITNPVCNDFSIAFWVKTTQTGGTPQWYNGAGLVDGDASGTANDFGTALVSGKFAFGVGNPDTTVLSTTAINDGAWHHCVATRQQATGVMSVYVDGKLQTTGTAGRNTLNASANLLFGEIGSGGSHYFNGSLDEVMMFTRVLSSNEVAALYGNLVSAPTNAPAGLTAIGGNAQVQLIWAKGSLARSYNLKRSLYSGGPFVTITNVAATTYTDTNVVNNRTYYYMVSAVNVIGEGANSVPVSATPVAMSAWFRADAITGLASGTAVPIWYDVSGNGCNAIQPTTNQPTYVTGAINGLPVVRFNSTNHTCLWLYRPVQDNFTIILVCQSSQNNQGTGTAFYNGSGLLNGDQSGSVNDFGMALNASGQVIAGTGNSDISIVSGTGFNNGSPHVISFTRTESTGALVLYVDGSQAATGTGNTNSLTAPPTLVLGEIGADNTGYLNGDIAEVQIYNTVLSSSDRSAQEHALKCKYAMSGGVVPLAPTQLTGVAGNRVISLSWVLSTGATNYSLYRSTNNGFSYQFLVGNLTNSGYVDASAVNGQMNYYKVQGVDGCGPGAYSAAAGVLLPLPALGMNASTNTLLVSWPSWASDWTLYCATNLTTPVAWTRVTNMAVVSNTVFNVTLPTASGNQFFRLASP